jgi:Spy/CpxP family protein refolding chaperone
VNGSLRWKLIVGVILAFLAGGMSGFFFASMHSHVFIEVHQPDLMSMRMKEHLRQQLNLTPDQEKKVSPIVEKMAAQLEQIRGETGDRVRKTMQDAHHEMEGLLTEEQKKELAQMEERHRTGHMMHRGMHPPPPDGEKPPPPP